MLKIVIIFAIAVLSFRSWSQQLTHFTQFSANTIFLNPAYAHSKNDIRVTGALRNQWIGLQGAPRTASLAFQVPIPLTNFKSGLSILQDKIGFYQYNNLGLNVSYLLKLYNIDIRFGISMNAIHIVNDLSKALTITANDPNFMQNKNRHWHFNSGTGIFIRRKGTYLSLSLPQISEKNMILTRADEIYRSRRHIYFLSGHHFRMDKVVGIRPSLLLKYVINNKIQADLSLALIFKQTLLLGVSYRSSNSLNAFLQVKLNKRFDFGYSHDFTTSKLGPHQQGTHELLITYDVSNRKREIHNPRYF